MLRSRLIKLYSLQERYKKQRLHALAIAENSSRVDGNEFSYFNDLNIHVFRSRKQNGKISYAHVFEIENHKYIIYTYMCAKYSSTTKADLLFFYQTGLKKRKRSPGTRKYAGEKNICQHFATKQRKKHPTAKTPMRSRKIPG